MALAVDEHVIVVVEHRGFTLERDGSRAPAARAWFELDARLPLRERFAERASDLALARGEPAHGRDGEAAQRRGDARGCARRKLSPIAVERPGVGAGRAVEEPFDELDREILAARSAKADRARDALAAFRDAVVRPARRQIEHVAGLEHVLFLGREAAQDLERGVAAQRGVEAARDSP